MTHVCGAAVVFFRLVLISAIVGKFAFAEDVCQGRKTDHLAQFLGNDDAKKMEGHIESKVLLSHMVQSIEKQTEKVDKMAEALGKIADALNVEKMGETLAKVLTKALDDKEVAKMEIATKCVALKKSMGGQFFIDLGKHYHYSTTTVNWFGAREYCQQMGMQLAMLKTLSQLEAVDMELKSHGFKTKDIWVSASDIGKTAGQFYWTDGTPVDSSTWDEINNGDEFGVGKETCVYLYNSYVKLFDQPCSSSKNILCEVPPALSPCFA